MFEFNLPPNSGTTEDRLLRSGFTPKDIKKLRNHNANFGSTLDSVVSGLSARFRGILYVTTALLIFEIIIVAVSSLDNIISCSIAVFFALAVIYLTTPSKLAYKSWSYMRNKANSAER